MAEKYDQEANEMGIQYKFSFPLRAKINQEFLITDTIDLVGSVGGMLGLFIGFSFSNMITCIIGYIGAFLASRNKFSDALWASIGWILYLSLMTTSIWFAWGVLDKYFKQDTGIQYYEENIQTHPTIVICMDSWKYQTDFKILYVVTKKDGFSLDDYSFLVIGQNYLGNLKEIVTLTAVYTRYNGLCYAINTTQNVDERKIMIKITPSTTIYNLPDTIPVIFTSEINSYGVTQEDWRDGEVFSFITSRGMRQVIDLTIEKNINLKCSNQSFYEYVASRLSEGNFEKCNETCLMTSLPNNPYPICPHYDEWYANDTNGMESNCNWHILRDLIKNITTNEEHLRTCITKQYLGKISDMKTKFNYVYIQYKFLVPLKAKVYEEYLITDGVTLIGSLGGTLSLFIGFSISNFVHTIMDFLQYTLETHFSRK